MYTGWVSMAQREEPKLKTHGYQYEAVLKNTETDKKLSEGKGQQNELGKAYANTNETSKLVHVGEIVNLDSVTG